MVKPVELLKSLTPTQVALFWAKVRKSDGCWEWTAGLDGGGYGVFSINRRMYKAHRISCVIHEVEIPEGKIVCHICDNPKCVRPNHFFIGTYEDNQKDAANKGRWKGLKNGTYTHPETRVAGERNGRCRLDVAKVHEIRHRYEAGGISQAALGREYGLTEGGIHNIVTRRTWAHV